LLEENEPENGNSNSGKKRVARGSTREIPLTLLWSIRRGRDLSYPTSDIQHHISPLHQWLGSSPKAGSLEAIDFRCMIFQSLVVLSIHGEHIQGLAAFENNRNMHATHKTYAGNSPAEDPRT
jgi:hypothetical protein